METLKSPEVVKQKIDTLAVLKPLGMQEPMRSFVLDKLNAVAEIKAIKRHTLTLEEAEDLYGPSGHFEDGSPRPHFYAITRYMAGKETDLILLHGDRDKIDDTIGPWRPEENRKDQLRGILTNTDCVFPVDVPVGYQNYVTDNLIHSSDSPESAKRELAIFFTPEELI